MSERVEMESRFCAVLLHNIAIQAVDQGPLTTFALVVVDMGH